MSRFRSLVSSSSMPLPALGLLAQQPAGADFSANADFVAVASLLFVLQDGEARSHHGLGLALDAALAQSIARPARAERHPTSKTCPASHHLPFGHKLVNRRARITHRRTRARAARPACRLRTLQGAVPQQTTAST